MKHLEDASPFVGNLLPALAQATSAGGTFEMYSSNWIVFQPDIIIDAVQGCMWKTELNLSAFPDMIADRCVPCFRGQWSF